MSLKVLKFGGSSLADATHFRQVADIVKADPTRRYVVASAPGKRQGNRGNPQNRVFLVWWSVPVGNQFETAGVVSILPPGTKPVYDCRVYRNLC